MSGEFHDIRALRESGSRSVASVYPRLRPDPCERAGDSSVAGVNAEGRGDETGEADTSRRDSQTDGVAGCSAAVVHGDVPKRVVDEDGDKGGCCRDFEIEENCISSMTSSYSGSP